MTARVADREVALEVRAPNGIWRGIVGQPLAIRLTTPPSTPRPHETVSTKEIPDGAGAWPLASSLLPTQNRQYLSRPPAGMPLSDGEHALDDSGGDRVGMGQRGSRAIHQRRNAAPLVSVHLFVASLATNTGRFAQAGKRHVARQVPGEEFHAFIHRCSLVPWHVSPCLRSVTHVLGLICYLCPRSGPKKCLTGFFRAGDCGGARRPDRLGG